MVHRIFQKDLDNVVTIAIIHCKRGLSSFLWCLLGKTRGDPGKEQAVGTWKITPLHIVKEQQERAKMKAAGGEFILRAQDELMKSVTKGRTISIPSVQSLIRSGRY